MEIEVFFRELDGLFAQGDLQRAEEYMRRGLNRAEADGDAAAALSIANELGGFYRVRTQYAQAVAMFEKVLSYVEVLNLKNSPHHATALLNYATMLTAAGDTNRALPIFNQAADIFRSAGGDPYVLAALDNNISSLYFQRLEYDMAMRHADAALATISRLPNSQDEQGVTHTKRAQILSRQGKPEAAKAVLEIAQKCFAEATAANSGHLSAMYLSIAEVCGQLEQWEDAVAHCRQALVYGETGTGRSLSCAAVLRMQALALRALGRELEAEQSEREAAEIEGRHNGGTA